MADNETDATTLEGIVHFFSETGTEGGHWAFQDERFIAKTEKTIYVCSKCGLYGGEKKPRRKARAKGNRAPQDAANLCADQHDFQPNVIHEWSYDGLHILENGDNLTICDLDVLSHLSLKEVFILMTHADAKICCMAENSSAQEVVAALVRVVSGNLPKSMAEVYLDPQVEMHMDFTRHHGITLWYKWIHLIRNCGVVRDLCMIPVEIRCDLQDPGLVHLTIRWSGTDRRGHCIYAPHIYHIRYLVRNGRIVELWTHKINYTFMLGKWIRYPICYRLFLWWAVLYFALQSLRGKDFLVDHN